MFKRKKTLLTVSTVFLNETLLGSALGIYKPVEIVKKSGSEMANKQKRQQFLEIQQKGGIIIDVGNCEH